MAEAPVATPQAPETKTTPTTPAVPSTETVTLNTTSVESKVGLYTKVTFVSLWLLVLATSSFVGSLVSGNGGASSTIFFVSAAIILAPIFVVANGKRSHELTANPALFDDIFVKKYVRKNLFVSIVFTALTAFFFVLTLLNAIFTDKNSADSGKVLAYTLVYALGFGTILAFSWQQHARTTK
jgi:hypothetical protein